MGKKELLFKEERKRVKVSDPWVWCPPFEGDTICVSVMLYEMPKNKFHAKITAWGADDTGMEICNDYNVFGAYEMFKKYIYDRMPEIISAEWLAEHGFVWA